MKLLGTCAGRAIGFREVLTTVAVQPTLLRCRLLRTMLEYGFLTDGVLLSRLTLVEEQELRRRHDEALLIDKAYATAVPLDLGKTLPPFLCVKVETVREVRGDGGASLMLLEGSGLRTLSLARAFHTLHERHPGAVWWFAAGHSFWRRPLVLLRVDLLADEGRLLGALAPIPLRPPNEVSGQGLPRVRSRVFRGRYFYYPPMEALHEQGQT